MTDEKIKEIFPKKSKKQHSSLRVCCLPIITLPRTGVVLNPHPRATTFSRYVTQKAEEVENLKYIYK